MAGKRPQRSHQPRTSRPTAARARTSSYLPEDDESRGLLKTIAWAMVAVALIAGGSFLYRYLDAKPISLTSDKELRELERLEHDKEYYKLIELLYNHCDPAFSKKVLPWLHAREDRGFAPYYYAQAIHLLNTGDADQDSSHVREKVPTRSPPDPRGSLVESGRLWRILRGRDSPVDAPVKAARPLRIFRSC